MSNISLVHNQYEYEKAIAKNEKNIYVQECCCTEEGDTNYQLQSVVIVKSSGEAFVTGGVVYAPVLVLSMLVYSLKK